MSRSQGRVALSLAAIFVALAVPAPDAGAAPAGTLDVDCTGGSNAGFGSFNSGAARAQTFTAGRSGKLLYTEVQRISRASGGAGGDIVVDVVATDATGVPTGSPLATGTIPGASIPADNVARTYEVTFAAATAAYLNQGTTYALVLHTADTMQNAWGVNTNACPGTTYLSTGGPFFLFAFVSGEDHPLKAYLGPANDDYSRAETLDGGADTATGTTAGGTLEAGEPDHYVTNPPDSDFWVGDHSVWYRWVAPRAGSVTVDVCTANIDSILAVYQGDASTTFGSLTRLVDNNNDATCPPGTFGSYATFNASAHTEYRLAVGDAGGARENTFTLALTGPPNQDPVVTPLKPAPGSKTRKRKPKIKATIEDEADHLVAGDIDFRLDDTPRAGFTYDQGAQLLSFRKKLRPGRHTVAIDVTDHDGGIGSATWTFKIKRR